MTWYTPPTFVAGAALTAANVRGIIQRDTQHELDTSPINIMNTNVASGAIGTMDTWYQWAPAATLGKTITKKHPDTSLFVDIRASAYASTAVPHLRWGTSVVLGTNTTAFGAGYLIYTSTTGQMIGITTSHQPVGTKVKTAPIPAGIYTVFPVFIMLSTLSVAGAVVQWDTNDYLSMAVMEVNT